ncbi:putative AbiEi antitoxin of type IV toxin-antitoxin system [Knoellia remsis]|uniref:Putative AbiEi antitoxin of type IV toxin-antitoxin system n=1 Tax=Knoellia remsis TaxID=407159 RepID=A0A2T0U667_9MICO|nr:type IV toxin-antitoxin system AbiEi family antitoxin domain-containing protein [Knoellia remsis]PRY53394.1 putative AbiEi antitoxin of type IV toxin-antitoxin system [Knoellia remsis]
MIELPEPLVELARGQHGMFTTRQAEKAGLTPFALLAAVQAGLLVHPGRGLYAVSALVDETSPSAWHQHLAAGARLVYPDAVLCSVSAVIAHGVDVWGTELSRANILRPVHRSAGMQAMRVRKLAGHTVVVTPLGPAVDVSTALAQHTVDHGITQGVVSADCALRDRLLTFDQLTAAVEAMAGNRNGSRGRAMLGFTNPLHESVAESRTAVALSMGGLQLDPQVEIRDGHGNFVARVDFLVRGTNVIVEFDGKLKYESNDVSVLWAEKKREDSLRRLGYVIVRLTWADLENGAALGKVRAVLTAA